MSMTGNRTGGHRVFFDQPDIEHDGRHPMWITTTAQAAEAGTTIQAGTGPVVTLVLVMLLGLSAATWAIVGFKIWRRRQIADQEARFRAVFDQEQDLKIIANSGRELPLSGQAALYCEAWAEIDTLHRHGRGPAMGNEGLARALERAIDRALIEVRIERERYLSFLASVASGAPFIGLFGTVWGIMSAFEAIGRMGSASLAVVAPGISEALIATAVGLLAAIPAAWAYNTLQRRIEEDEATMAVFRLELLNLLEAFVFPDLLRTDRGTSSAQDTDGTVGTL